MAKYQHYQASGAAHPYAHRLTLKPTTSYIQRMAPERSLTVTNLHITPRTAFQMERPQTQGSPKVVVINTSFRSTFTDRLAQRRRIPTFPQLATDHGNRNTSVSRLTNSSVNTMNNRLASASSFRRDTGSAGRRQHSANLDRTPSSKSDRRTGPHRTFLTQRQTHTFAAYAKYNDIVNSTRAREKASDSPITSNINDLSALTPQRIPRPQEVVLSNEKHVWISDWIASTTAALNLAEGAGRDEDRALKTLSVIHEH